MASVRREEQLRTDRYQEQGKEKLVERLYQAERIVGKHGISCQQEKELKSYVG